MKKAVFPVVLSIIPSGLSARDNGEKPGDDFCQPHPGLAQSVMNRFLNKSDDYIDTFVSDELRKAAPVPMSGELHGQQCFELTKRVLDKIIKKTENGEAKWTYLLDVSFFRVGKLYAVVITKIQPIEDRVRVGGVAGWSYMVQSLAELACMTKMASARDMTTRLSFGPSKHPGGLAHSGHSPGALRVPGLRYLLRPSTACFL